MNAHRCLVVLGLLAALPACGGRSGAEDSNAAADGRSASAPGGAAASASSHGVGLLAPGAFPRAPRRVADKLAAQGCQVAQAKLGPSPNNLIVGSFAKRRQADYAALCAHGDRMIVRIAWGGPGQCPDSISDSERSIADDRTLGVADSFFIIGRDPRADGKPVPVSHDGIAESKGASAVVWYCADGKWLALR